MYRDVAVKARYGLQEHYSDPCLLHGYMAMPSPLPDNSLERCEKIIALAVCKALASFLAAVFKVGDCPYPLYPG